MQALVHTLTLSLLLAFGQNLVPVYIISCYFWFYFSCLVRLPPYITSACVAKNTLLKEPWKTLSPKDRLTWLYAEYERYLFLKTCIKNAFIHECDTLTRNINKSVLTNCPYDLT